MNYKKLIDIYRTRINRYAPSWLYEVGLTLCSENIQSCNFNPEGGSRGPFANNCHMLRMLDEMEELVSRATGGEPHLETKLNRLLGFIQGVLWTQGMSSIEDLHQDMLSAELPE